MTKYYVEDNYSGIICETDNLELAKKVFNEKKRKNNFQSVNDYWLQLVMRDGENLKAISTFEVEADWRY